MVPRRDPDARRKWERAWTSVRTWYDIDQDPPPYIYSNEYLFEYLAVCRLRNRDNRDWLSYPAPERLAQIKLVDQMTSKLQTEEKLCE